MRRIAPAFFLILAIHCSYGVLAQCDFAWATWDSLPSPGTARGNFDLHTWDPQIDLSADHPLTFVDKIHNYSKFDKSYTKPADGRVCETSWAGYPGGHITACFSTRIQNSFLLLASVGSATRGLTLQFDVPYKVIYAGEGVQFTNDSTLTGFEGYCIISFPGIYKCITISSSSTDDFTQFTWGLGNGVRTYFNYTNDCKGNINFAFDAMIEAPYTMEDPVWRFGDGSTFTYPLGESPIHHYASSGSYLLIVTVRTDEPCVYTYYDQIVVNIDTIIENPQIICPGQSYQFNNRTHTTNGTYYDIFPKPPFNCSTTVITRLSVFPDTVNLSLSRCKSEGLLLPGGEKTDSPGIYFIPQVSPQGCPYIQVTNLSIIPEKEVTIQTTDATCYGYKDGTVRFEVVPDTATAPYTYVLDKHTQTTELFSDLAAGIYPYKILDRSQKCATPGIIEIKQPRKILIDVWPNDIMIPFGEAVTLKASGNYKDIKFKWFVPQHPSVCDTCEELTVKPEENTRYPVSAKVKINDKYCMADSFASIRIRPILYSPTAFTPNNDGTNDFFSVDGLSLENISLFEVLIYNRWGALVFRSEDAYFKWDGTVGGNPAPQGVYTCTIRHRIIGKEKDQPEINQNITLLR